MTLLLFLTLKAETDAFIDEGVITSAALLFWWRGFRLLKDIERSIERPHAQMTKAAHSASHHGPVYQSYSLRSSEIKRHIEETPTFFLEFSQCCTAVRGTKTLAKTLGFFRAPPAGRVIQTTSEQ